MSAQIVTFKGANNKLSEKLVIYGYYFVKKEVMKDGTQQWRCDFFRIEDGGCTAKVWTKTNAQNQITITRATQHTFDHSKKKVDKVGEFKNHLLKLEIRFYFYLTKEKESN